MVIATFGPSTAWVGKTITFENGQFILEGKGPIPAVSVLAYDREGHLAWAYAGLREWVEQIATGGAVPEPAAATMPVVTPVSVSAAPVAGPVAIPRPAQGKRRFPVWAIVLIAVAAAFALLILLVAAFLIPVWSTSTTGSDPGAPRSSGATWNAQVSAPGEDLRGVAFSDATHGWVVGSLGTILATTDGGATWNEQRSGSGAYLNAIAFTDATRGWVVGTDGAVLATANGDASR
jgi:hypothetical protein